MATQQTQMQMKGAQIQMAEAERNLQQPTEVDVAMMSIQEKAKKDAADSSVKERDSEIKFVEVLSKIRNEQVDNELAKERLDAENTRSAVDAMISTSKYVNDLNKSWS